MYRLIIEDEEGRQSVVPIPRSEITIGRREGNTIRLNERNVSRLHARLLEGQGELFLEDAGSRYGIKVNGQRLVGRLLLRPGDDIYIGSYHLSVMKEDGPVVVQRAPILADPGQESPMELARRTTLGETAPAAPTGRVCTPIGDDPAFMPRLSFLGPDAPEDFRKDILLWNSRSTIGRTTENDIAVIHPTVKRRHALLVYDGELHRLQAAEGVDNLRVNGQAIKRTVLCNGDLVEIGAIPLWFYTPKPTVPATPTEIPVVSLPEDEKPPPQPSGRWRSTALALLGLSAAAVLVFVFFASSPPGPFFGQQPGPGSATTARPGEATEELYLRGERPLDVPYPGPVAELPPPGVGTARLPRGVDGGLAVEASRGPGSIELQKSSQIAELLMLAQQAMSDRSWDAAQTALEAALKQGERNAEIEKLFVRAQEEKRADQQLARALELAAQENSEAAFLAVRSVPVTSVYHGEAEKLAQRLMNQVVALHLDRGKQHLKRGDAAAALEEYQAARALAPKNRRAIHGEKLALAELSSAAAPPSPGGSPPPGEGKKPRQPAKVEEGARKPGRGRPEPTAGAAPPAAASPGGKSVRPGPEGAKGPEEARRPPTRRDEAIQLYQKGRVLYAKGMMNDAEQMMKQAIELVPNFADPHLSLALIFARQQQKERALAEFRQFLLIAPNDPRRPMVEGMMKSISSGGP